MLDVYFAVRYLQLHDNVPDDERDRTTLKTLEQLHEAKSIEQSDFQALSEGYRLLRSVESRDASDCRTIGDVADCRSPSLVGHCATIGLFRTG
jgi:hypothetical protein